MAHSQWRVRSLGIQNNGNFCSIAEISMAATVGGADQCAGGTAIASSVFGAGATADLAYDNDNNTFWTSASDPVQTNHWNGYTFAAPVDCASWVLVARNDSSYILMPWGFAIDYADGGAWTEYIRFGWFDGPIAWTQGQSRTFSIEGADEQVTTMAQNSLHGALAGELVAPAISQHTLLGGPDVLVSPTISQHSVHGALQSGLVIADMAQHTLFVPKPRILTPQLF